MPLPYTPYKLASASLAAPTSPAASHSRDEDAIAVPTPQHPGVDSDPEPVNVAHHHAVDARLYFPSSSLNAFDGGYVLARVVGGGRELQLLWSTLQDQNAAAGPSSKAVASKQNTFSASLNPKLASEPARTFLFPAPLLPGLGFFADPASNRLYVIAVTTTGYLYRLVFSAPHLFHETRLASDWSSEYRIQHIASSDSVLTASIRGAANAAQLYVVDSGLALVTCADGTIVKLNRSVSGSRDANDGTWKETVLRPTSFLSGVSRFFGRSNAVSDSESSPTYALSLDVFPGDVGNAMAFAASRDRKLRVWNLLTDSCIRTIDLPLQMESAASNEKQLVVVEDDSPSTLEASETQAYFSTVSRPFVKVFTPGSDDKDGYALYVLAYIPASPPSGNFFALYGVELEDTKGSSGGLGEVTLLWQKRCDADTRGRNVELRDVVFTPQGERGDGWVMWALWDAGAGPVLKYAKVGVEAANPDESSMSLRSVAEDLSKDDWRTVSSERVYRPLHGEDFEATLEATKEVIDAADIFLDRVLEPGRFSEATLRLALSTYKEVASSSAHQASTLFASLRDEVASVVASGCHLENDPRTGGPMYEKLYASRVREWMRFVGLAEQIETAARWPIGLSLPGSSFDGEAIVPLVIGRDTIALPVNEDEASIVERLQRTLFASSSKPRSGAALAADSASEERALLIHAADSHPTNILPTLGRTSATVAEVLTLVESASDLAACFTAPELEAFAAGLQNLLSEPLTVSVKEAIADVWSNNFASLGGEEASEIVARIASDLGASLDSTLTDMAVLLSETASHVDELVSASSIASTDLGSALTADALIQTLASRHRLAVSFMLLLTALAAEDKMADVVENESRQIAAALSIFQSLGAALQLARTDATIQVAGSIADAAETDSIVAKLNQMSVAGRKSRELHHFTAPTLLHQCVCDEVLSTAKASGQTGALSLSVKWAVLSGLWSLGLTDLRETLSAEAKPLLPYLTDRHTAVAFAVLVQGYPLAAETLLASFPETPAGEYVRARALVQMQRLDDASASFDKVVSALELPSSSRSRAASGLFELLPSSIVIAEGEERVAAYYRHVALFFEPFEAIEHVIRFCQASIDAVGTYADDRPSTDAAQASGPKEVWFKIFRCQLALDDFEAAYATVMATPYEGVRKDCLRNLVSVMCEEGHIQPLLHFTFPGLQSEVEKTLSFKARNSDPLSVPNYYAVLYSFHVFRGDLKSAGAVMYQHAERLGELHRAVSTGSDGGDALERFMIVAVEQAQSYLASINALTMLQYENAWFAHAADAEHAGGSESLFDASTSVRAGAAAGKQTSSLTRYIPASAYSQRVREIRVVSVDDVRREYSLALARLELVKRYPDLAYSTTVLRPSDAVLLFVNSDAFDSAFGMAWSLGVDMTPIFGALTVKAVALARAKLERDAFKHKNGANGSTEEVHPEIAELEEADEDVLEPEALFLTLSDKSAGWAGSAAERAWRYVRHHLEMYDSEEDGKYYRVVLSRIAALDHAVTPSWLTEWFTRTHNTDVLLRIWIQHRLLVEAAAFATQWLQDATAQAGTLTRANEQYVSNHIIDTLLVNLDDKTGTVVASRRDEASRAKVALQQARKKHVEALAARGSTLKRQAEQDALRQERRREQQGGAEAFGRPAAGLRAF
ncbi:related to nuclear pore complex protein Nup160 [Sporisorium reilianum f. sp. reilianum]|uniref:Related to nuclear pore complex protein Nup160 n=1 Tax=Sporisorium reilianum f. sp. reilianum TaxID=72559 RepID=A0A2N8U7F6_9BASI|nr:related to nuclear pore complex protein Nup160 [Sporisorium reilianum f. sp. reilianum]